MSMGTHRKERKPSSTLLILLSSMISAIQGCGPMDVLDSLVSAGPLGAGSPGSSRNRELTSGLSPESMMANPAAPELRAGRGPGGPGPTARAEIAADPGRVPAIGAGPTATATAPSPATSPASPPVAPATRAEVPQQQSSPSLLGPTAGIRFVSGEALQGEREVQFDQALYQPSGTPETSSMLI